MGTNGRRWAKAPYLHSPSMQMVFKTEFKNIEREYTNDIINDLILPVYVVIDKNHVMLLSYRIIQSAVMNITVYVSFIVTN